MAHPVEIHPVAEVLHPMEGEIRPMAEAAPVMEELHLAVTDHLAEVHLAGDHPEATAHPEEAHLVVITHLAEVVQVAEEVSLQ